MNHSVEKNKRAQKDLFWKRRNDEMHEGKKIVLKSQTDVK